MHVMTIVNTKSQIFRGGGGGEHLTATEGNVFPGPSPKFNTGKNCNFEILSFSLELSL